jgi:hypothetical protein
MGFATTALRRAALAFVGAQAAVIASLCVIDALQKRIRRTREGFPARHLHDDDQRFDNDRLHLRRRLFTTR